MSYIFINMVFIETEKSNIKSLYLNQYSEYYGSTHNYGNAYTIWNSAQKFRSRIRRIGTNMKLCVFLMRVEIVYRIHYKYFIYKSNFILKRKCTHKHKYIVLNIKYKRRMKKKQHTGPHNLYDNVQTKMQYSRPSSFYIAYFSASIHNIQKKLK